MIEIEDQAIALLAEPLAKIGYTQVKRVSLKGREGIWRVDFIDPNPDHAMTRSPTVEAYVQDLYPSRDRGEAMLLVWNWIGMTGKGLTTHVAAALTKAGIPARATTNKGDACVRFKFSPDYS